MKTKLTKYLLFASPLILVAMVGLWHLPVALERASLDKEVARLCAIDGGVHVFETASLPADRPAVAETVRIPYDSDTTNFGYFYKSSKELIGGRGGEWGPGLERLVTTVVKTENLKVMGTEVVYVSYGGELMDGWKHVSGIHCPMDQGGHNSVFRAVFPVADK
ncbi:MAG: hypothetical protein WBJ19_00790 [Rhodoferax sp.]